MRFTSDGLLGIMRMVGEVGDGKVMERREERLIYERTP